MRRRNRAGPAFRPIEDELAAPNPQAYRNRLARFIADLAASEDPERATRRLMLARAYEAGHYRRHPEEYAE